MEEDGGVATVVEAGRVGGGSVVVGADGGGGGGDDPTNSPGNGLMALGPGGLLLGIPKPTPPAIGVQPGS